MFLQKMCKLKYNNEKNLNVSISNAEPEAEGKEITLNVWLFIVSHLKVSWECDE